MFQQPPHRTLEATPADVLVSPWLDQPTEAAVAFDGWRRDVDECFRPNHWQQRIGDPVHFGTVMRAVSPPAFKLLYDSYVWRRVLAAQLGPSPSQDILEILPGRSLTVPVALQTLGFRGHLHRADFTPQGPLPPGLDFATSWEPGDVLLRRASPAPVVLGNHVLDDMIATWHYGPVEYLTRIYGNPVAEQEAWSAIAASRRLPDAIGEVVGFFRRLLSSPGLTLLLREYPATVAILHGNVAHVAVHSACYAAVIAECRRWGASVEHPDPAGDDVPAGSRHCRSFLAVVV